MNSLARPAAAALICALALAVSGCGGTSEQFTSAEAARALAALDAIQSFVDAGRCSAAEKRVKALASQSTHVNSDRPDLGEAYASSVARLETLVTRECVEIAPASPTPETTAATGATGNNNGPTATEPTGGGGSDTPATPDNTNNQDNNGGAGGGTNQNQNQNQNTSPPENSGGAGPGT